MKRHFIISVLMLLAGSLVLAMGWRGSKEDKSAPVYDQTYDTHREAKFEGKILRIDPEPCVELPASSYHFHLQLSQEQIEVHLGPCWYVQQQKLILRVGDTVKGIGSEASWKSKGLRVFMAREIRRGKEDLHLRDRAGKPYWKAGDL